MKNNCLFLFTKQFPFGTTEQYIANELPSLSNEFDRVIIIPTDFFQFHMKNTRSLQENVSVLNINQNLSSFKKKRVSGTLEILKIFFWEFFSTNLKGEFFRNFRKNLNVLRHHQAMANALAEILKKEYSANKNYFYSYWMHQSVIMLAILKQRKILKQFVARAHSLDLYQEDWGYLIELKLPGFKMFKINNTGKIFSISEHGESYLKQKYPAHAEKIYKSYLGVNDNGLNPYDKNSIFTIITCSNLSENKRMNKMPGILKLLNFETRWIHFGDGEERNSIEEKIRNFPERIKVFLMGSVSNEKIIDFYKKNTVHLFINLSMAEGLPVSLMEAASFGIPMLATSVYGNPEIVVPGKTGFLVPDNFKVDEVSKIISDFHSNLSLQEQLRKGAREHFLKNFNASVNYPDFVNRIKQANE